MIARDRYLDHTSRFHLTLLLQSRTIEMHGVLSDLTHEEMDAVGDVLVRGLNEIAALLRSRIERPDSRSASVG